MKLRGYTKAIFMLITGAVVLGVNACGGGVPATPAPAATETPAAATDNPAVEIPPECKPLDQPDNPDTFMWDCSRDDRQILFSYVPKDFKPINLPINEKDWSKQLEKDGKLISIAANIAFQDSSGAPVTSFPKWVKLELGYRGDDAGNAGSNAAGEANLRPVFTSENIDVWPNFNFQDVYILDENSGRQGAAIWFTEWNNQSVGWATPQVIVECSPIDVSTWDCSREGEGRKVIFRDVPAGVRPVNVPIHEADYNKKLPNDDDKLISIVGDIWFLNDSGELVTEFPNPIVLELYYNDQDKSQAGLTSDGQVNLRPIYTTRKSETWLDFLSAKIEYIENGVRISEIKEWSDQPEGLGTPKR